MFDVLINNFASALNFYLYLCMSSQAESRVQIPVRTSELFEVYVQNYIWNLVGTLR